MSAFDLPPTELARHRPVPDEPEDFDAFWLETLAGP
ncbi:acetylxylan esterase, partial [Streptomyces sp. SID5926]|nr:acetylxylan esterase [Streptomyces sp. SID5926]